MKLEEMTIADRWADFRDKCIAADVGGGDLAELRQSFYAGFGASFDVTLALVSEDTPEQVCRSGLDAIADELDEFVESILADAARLN